ncbi:LOW QUALITY PROTEIN: hypothetical protein U9M48_042812 [Paspalum notatum var. saurae]|uniref:Uncharacterized protein n=1 Tax=Paspalum notatum var. saurae TaxID=547442 RepID=A0AAQ3URD2_PASNO
MNGVRNSSSLCAPCHCGLLLTPPTALTLPAPRTDQAASSSSQGGPTAGQQTRRLTPDEMEDRCRQGLCFNCDEKYMHGHNRVCKHLFVMEFGYPCNMDDDADETVPTAPDTAPVISLHAIMDVRTGRMMQVPMCWGTATLHVLFDSGSSLNFVSEEAARLTRANFRRRQGMHVTVANGKRVPCLGAFNDAAFTIHDEQLQGSSTSFRWPATMWCWAPNGWRPWAPCSGTLVASPWSSGGAAHRCAAWASPRPRSFMQYKVKTSFNDLFAEPQGLPPARPCDHRIHLRPRMVLVAVRPYRYLAT